MQAEYKLPFLIYKKKWFLWKRSYINISDLKLMDIMRNNIEIFTWKKKKPGTTGSNLSLVFNEINISRSWIQNFSRSDKNV